MVSIRSYLRLSISLTVTTVTSSFFAFKPDNWYDIGITEEVNTSFFEDHYHPFQRNICGSFPFRHL